jgi:hypothetical protein
MGEQSLGCFTNGAEHDSGHTSKPKPPREHHEEKPDREEQNDIRKVLRDRLNLPPRFGGLDLCRQERVDQRHERAIYRRWPEEQQSNDGEPADGSCAEQPSAQGTAAGFSHRARLVFGAPPTDASSGVQRSIRSLDHQRKLRTAVLPFTWSTSKRSARMLVTPSGLRSSMPRMIIAGAPRATLR